MVALIVIVVGATLFTLLAALLEENKDLRKKVRWLADDLRMRDMVTSALAAEVEDLRNRFIDKRPTTDGAVKE